MTTIINPGTSQTVVYNLSGTTITTMAADVFSGDPTGNDGAVVPSYSGTTVVVLYPPITWLTSESLVATFPTNTEIGDVVEVYGTPGSFTSPLLNPVFNIFPAVGESIGPQAISTGTNQDIGIQIDTQHGAIFRKVSATSWQGTVG